MKNFRNLSCLLLVLAVAPAWAQEAGGEELVEKVVVRNRLFNVEGRFELGINFGFSMLSRLTDHTNFTLSIGYNFLDSLAVEVRVGYALSGHTGLAQDISDKFFLQSKTAIPTATDLQDLWEMKFNAVAGLRWQPVYGKLGLMAEVPVHFQAYVWLGVGVGMFDRQSVVICNREGVVQNPDTGKNETKCIEFLKDSKFGVIFPTAALGFRFFLGDHHVVRLEFRDISWFDSYLTGANRTAALNPSNPTGNGTPVSGNITNMVQFDLGYTFIF